MRPIRSPRGDFLVNNIEVNSGAYYFYKIKQCEENGQKYVYFRYHNTSIGNPNNATCFEYIGDPSLIQVSPNQFIHDEALANFKFEVCNLENTRIKIKNELSLPTEINIRKRNGYVKGFVIYDYKTSGYSIYDREFTDIHMDLSAPFYSGNLNKSKRTYYDDNIEFTFEIHVNNRINELFIRKKLKKDITNMTNRRIDEIDITLTSPDTNNKVGLREQRYVRIPDNKFRVKKELEISQSQQYYYEFYKNLLNDDDNLENMKTKIGKHWEIRSTLSYNQLENMGWSDATDAGGISVFVMTSFAKNALFYKDKTLETKKMNYKN